MNYGDRGKGEISGKVVDFTATCVFHYRTQVSAKLPETEHRDPRNAHLEWESADIIKKSYATTPSNIHQLNPSA